MTTKTLATAAPLPGRSRAVAEFLRYFGTSFVAMCVDVLLLKLSMAMGLHYAVGASIGFIAGLAVVYLLSVTWVFESRTMSNVGAEFVLFAAIGIAGLGLTEAILWALVEKAGTSVAVAKLFAIPCVFFFNYGVRKALLFRGRR